MTRPTRQMRSAVILEGGALGYSPGDIDEELPEPTDVASLVEGAAIQVATSVSTAGELLEGETVTSSTDTGTPPADPTNVNDRDYETNSEKPAGVYGGSYAWEVDFGSAVEVTSMAVDDPVLPIGGPEFTDPASAFPEWSDDGLAYTPAAFTYSTATVPTGLGPPSPSTTPRYIYSLDTPATHRHWRLRKTVSAGFHVADAMAEWLIFGTLTNEVAWTAAPAANDDDDATYAVSDATFPGDEWLQADLGVARVVYRAELRVGHDSAGSKTLELWGSEDAAFTSPVLLDSVTVDATGSLAADDVTFAWVPTTGYQYYRIKSPAHDDRRVYDLNMYSAIGTGGGTNLHPLLEDRDVADQHPAAAISLADLANLLAAATVEAAVAEIARKAIGYDPHGNLGAAATFDAAFGWHSGTLDDDCTFTLTAGASGTASQLLLELAQDGTGGHAISLPASVVNKAELEATQDTTASETTFLALWSRDGGTAWYGGWIGQSSGGSVAIDDGATTVDPAQEITFAGTGLAGVTVTDDTGGAATVTVDVALTETDVRDAGRWEPVVTDGELLLMDDDVVMMWIGG